MINRPANGYGCRHLVWFGKAGFFFIAMSPQLVMIFVPRLVVNQICGLSSKRLRQNDLDFPDCIRAENKHESSRHESSRRFSGAGFTQGEGAPAEF
jgi:hypothetical protein